MGCARSRLTFILMGLFLFRTNTPSLARSEIISSMSAAQPQVRRVVSPSAAATRCRQRSRWWLAGLLVSCLLPAGLTQAETLRLAERVVQTCILAPTLMRARCRYVARRRALPWWPRRLHAVSVRRIRRFPLPVDKPRNTADHDVLTRRGPPTAPALPDFFRCRPRCSQYLLVAADGYMQIRAFHDQFFVT